MRGSRIAVLLAAGVVVAWCSCTRQELEQTVRRVTKKAEQVAQPVSNMEFQLGPEGSHRTGACYAQLLSAGSTGAAVLQLTTYEQAEAETFPSLFLRARVSAASWADLAGQQLEAELFAQLRPDDSVWHSDPQHPVILHIAAVDDQRIEGTFQGGPVGNSRNRQQRKISGSFRALRR